MNNREYKDYISNEYCKLIKLCESKLKSLESNRPFSFQRKKLKKHNELIDNYNDKLMELYTKLGEVCDFEKFSEYITIKQK